MTHLAKAGRGTAAALALALCGCSSAGFGNNNYSQYFQLMRQGLSASMGHAKVTRAQAAAIPYASLGYRLDGGNQMMLLLATDTNGDLLWTSSNHVVIVTRDGRIVRSIGLGRDLAGLNTSNRAPPLSAAFKSSFSTSRFEDFPDLGLYGVSVTCRASAVGRQKIAILGQAITTVRVDERCRSDRLDWSFVDSFWVDADSGLVWRSRQTIHPKGGIVELDTLRPPG